jgi:hypothetical protein
MESRPDDSATGAEPETLAQQVATSTTRLIVIAVLGGGLLAAAINLSEPLTDHAPPLIQTDAAAPLDDLLREGFPIVQEAVEGTEDNARQALVDRIQGRLATAVQTHESLGTAAPRSALPSGLDGMTELATDVQGRWVVCRLDETPRLVLGVSLAGREPTVVVWGGYDERQPAKWNVWTMTPPAGASE